MLDNFILSRENRTGECSCCGDVVSGMAFVRRKDKSYYYACYDCMDIGHSIRGMSDHYYAEVDEDRMLREEIVSFLTVLAEEDEVIFKDHRLSVIHAFKDEVVDGVVTDKMDRYLRFNGNDITEVLKIRRFAVECVRLKGEPYTDIVRLYISSRVRKLSEEQVNKIHLLLSDKRIQCLDADNKLVWDNIEDAREEAFRESSVSRYEGIDDIRDIFKFYDAKDFLTENQLARLKSFYFEMLRRSKKR